MNHKVLIDTDIGDDIDDLFALIFALSQKQINITHIMVSSGDVHYKAKLVASILQTLHKEHISIIKAVMKEHGCLAQNELLKDFSLSDYKGIIYEDYQAALSDLFSKEEKLDVLELGPITDLAVFLKNNPSFCDKVHLYYMGGAVNHGYINQEKADAEYNVLLSYKESNWIFEKLRYCYLLPLDCCYDLIINGEDYDTFLTIQSDYAALLRKHYRVWIKDYQGGSIKFDPNVSTSILYDLAVIMFYLHPSLFEVDYRALQINKAGKTIIRGNKQIPYVCKLHDKKKLIHYFLSGLEGDDHA